MKLLLFDIDGTLMLSGGAGFRAMERAIEQRYGVTGATEGVVPDGKTDLLILREVLRASGLAVGDEERAMRELMTMYEGYLAEEMPTSPAVLMPGVPELLETLSVVDGILLGLLTGNFEHTARTTRTASDCRRWRWPAPKPTPAGRSASAVTFTSSVTRPSTWRARWPTMPPRWAWRTTGSRWRSWRRQEHTSCFPISRIPLRWSPHSRGRDVARTSDQFLT
jgi:hypothetical protein